MEKEKQELMQKAEMFAKTQDLNKSLTLTENIEDEALKQKFEEEQLPDKVETKKIRNKIRKIWSDYRKNALDSIDLENYKKYCELQEIKAESEKRLSKLKREKEKEENEHWIEMRKGHLEELKFNTQSRPNKFWYGLNRGIWYLRKTFDNIPKLVWKLLLSGIGIALVIGVVLIVQRIA